MIAFTTSSSSFYINRDKIKLCNTCDWCASDIGSKSKFTKCPSWAMPIAKNELYKFDCHP
jgi:hypothetical protein